MSLIIIKEEENNNLSYTRMFQLKNIDTAHKRCKYIWKIIMYNVDNNIG